MARAGGITYQHITPGPLPFADHSFDVVFSKDALIHVQDKAALYREAFRVLRPGGHLLASDWLRGTGADNQALVDAFIAAAGHAFYMETLTDVAAHVAQAGFAAIETEDRGAWYLGEARQELARLQGHTGRDFVAAFGQKAADDETGIWVVPVQALEGGALSPGHVRARKA